MNDAMVTGRMSLEKKDAGNAVLARAGIKPSQAVNLLYDLLIDRQDASFLIPSPKRAGRDAWIQAAREVDSLVLPWKVDSRFEGMSNRQVALERLEAKGAL